MKFEFSAGGIVFKYHGDEILVLVCQHSYHHGWVFPKGLIGDHVKHEGKEETALREVEEETGVRGKILCSLSETRYWYVFEGQKIRKTVYFFLMKYISGDITRHDFEMEKVEWLPIEKIKDKLTYPSDKKVWQEAKEIIENSTYGR